MSPRARRPRPAPPARSPGPLGAVLALALAAPGCGGPEELPRGALELRRPAELTGAPPRRARGGDFWTDTLGDYLDRSFREAPPPERFARWGPALLEYALREERLAPHRDALGPLEIDEFCRAPGYDASEAFLRAALGQRDGAVPE